MYESMYKGMNECMHACPQAMKEPLNDSIQYCPLQLQGLSSEVANLPREQVDEPVIQEDTGTFRDGTFAGASHGGNRPSYAGLGTRPVQEKVPNRDDPFQDFRNRRSNTYHDFMATRGTITAKNLVRHWDRT